MTDVQAPRRIGSFYTVTPGLGEAVTFERTLEGLCGKHGALQEAIRMSAGGQAQTVLVTEGRATRAIREYLNGKETWRSGAGLIPPPAPPQVSDRPEDVIIPLRRRRPDFSLSYPPCSTAT